MDKEEKMTGVELGSRVIIWVTIWPFGLFSSRHQWQGQGPCRKSAGSGEGCTRRVERSAWGYGPAQRCMLGRPTSVAFLQEVIVG